MGLTIALQTARGENAGVVHDPRNLLHRLLPPFEDKTFECLRYVDWYGDTVFNRLQMDSFLGDWQRIENNANSSEESEILQRVRDLATRCKEEPHLYLRFIGD